MMCVKYRRCRLTAEADNGLYQVFLNIVLDDAVEEKDNGEKAKLGMVVRATFKLGSRHSLTDPL